MFDKIKKTVVEHKKEILIGALIVGGVIIYNRGFAAGVKSAWPPNHLTTNFFDKAGKTFMVLNGRLYEAA